MALSIFSPISNLLNFGGSSRRDMDGDTGPPPPKRRKTSSTTNTSSQQQRHRHRTARATVQNVDHSDVSSSPHSSHQEPSPQESHSPSSSPSYDQNTTRQHHNPTSRRKHLTHIDLELKRLEDTLPPRPHKNSPPAIPQGRAALAAHRADDKRILRSQDGLSKSRSSLAQFFPDFDDVLFGQEQAPETLNAATVFFVTDLKPEGNSSTPNSPSASRKVTSPKKPRQNDATLEQHGADPTFKRHDFSDHLKDTRKIHEDPLGDSAYTASHRRGERREKQLRNIEKERAMHEKGELERLLLELKGPDWLRSMGISGIVDTEKKQYESKREHYIQAVKDLLRKFASWREQEKELKHRLEAVASSSDSKTKRSKRKADDTEPSSSHPQDHQNNANDTKTKSIKLRLTNNAKDQQTLQSKVDDIYAVVSPPLPKKPAQELEPPKPFVTFFEKSYERAAAVGKHRRGRAVHAFGQAIPEPAEEEFFLPESVLTPDVLRQNARKRRRLKRDTET